MSYTIGIIDGNKMSYDISTDILSFKDNHCTLTALLEAVKSPIDRIMIENTDLLLVKTDLYYKIGCVKLTIEEFYKYKQKINTLKRINNDKNRRD